MQITIHHYNHSKTTIDNVSSIHVDGAFPNPTLTPFRPPVLVIQTETGIRRINWNVIKNFTIKDENTKETDF